MNKAIIFFIFVIYCQGEFETEEPNVLLLKYPETIHDHQFNFRTENFNLLFFFPSFKENKDKFKGLIDLLEKCQF